MPTKIYLTLINDDLSEFEAIYPYAAKEEGDISLNIGDIVYVYEVQEDGWARGCVGNNEGFFPRDYVQVCRSSLYHYSSGR